MKCYHCAVEADAKKTNHIVDMDDCIIIVRQVPSYVCPQCGEVMYTVSVAKQIEQYVEAAKSAMSDLSVINYQNLIA